MSYPLLLNFFESAKMSILDWESQDGIGLVLGVAVQEGHNMIGCHNDHMIWSQSRWLTSVRWDRKWSLTTQSLFWEHMVSAHQLPSIAYVHHMGIKAHPFLGAGSNRLNL